MTRHLLCTFLLVITWSLGQVPAQVVTASWATLPQDAHPSNIACDLQGNIYVANNNSTVSRVTPDGNLSAAWAVLPGSSVRRAIVVDGPGNVYTTNYGDKTISKITPEGIVTPGWAALQAGPTSMAIDGSGNMYTANIGNSTVSKVTPGAEVTQNWATLPAHSLAWSIIVDGAGNQYTMNTASSTISKITAAGIVTDTWATVSQGSVLSPNTFDASGNLYIVNSLTGDIDKISEGGIVNASWANVGPDADPSYVIKDNDGNLYTANFANNTISKITPAGVVTPNWVQLEAGANPSAMTFDISGNLYILNTGNNTVSKILSAIHPDANGIIYVDSAAAPGGDGSSWSSAAPDLSDALHYARSYASAWENSDLQIYVAKGTYVPKYDASDNSEAVGDRDAAFVLVKNVQLLGGFPTGGGGNLRNWATNPTVLSGELGAANDNTDNANHVVVAAGDIGEGLLDGFTITGGNATGTGAVTVNGLAIQRIAGGGIYTFSSDLTLGHLTIAGNTAQSGGGLYCNGSAVIISNTLISHNTASNGGGIRLYNCVHTPRFVNITVAGNTADLGGGVANVGSNIRAYNSIFFANTATTDKNIHDAVAQGNSFVYCLVEGSNGWEAAWGTNGGGIVTADSPFKDMAGGDYQLASASAAINAGNNAQYSVNGQDLDNQIDLEGNPRVYQVNSGGTIDLGAYEYQGSMALPVKTSPLTGYLDKDGAVILSWHTYTETGNKGFQVEYSADGAHFETGPFVPSKALNGNSSTPLDYKFNAGRLTGTRYYRFKQMNLAGDFVDAAYSNVLHLQGVGNSFRFFAYPNPARDFITLQVEGEEGLVLKGRVVVVDLSGRVLKRQNITGADAKVDLFGLAAGVYVLKYMDETHDASVKFIKK